MAFIAGFNRHPSRRIAGVDAPQDEVEGIARVGEGEGGVASRQKPPRSVAGALLCRSRLRLLLRLDLHVRLLLDLQQLLNQSVGYLPQALTNKSSSSGSGFNFSLPLPGK